VVDWLLLRPSAARFGDGRTTPLLLVTVRLPAEGGTSFETRPALIGIGGGYIGRQLEVEYFRSGHVVSSPEVT